MLVRVRGFPYYTRELSINLTTRFKGKFSLKRCVVTYKLIEQSEKYAAQHCEIFPQIKANLPSLIILKKISCQRALPSRPGRHPREYKG